MKAHILASWKGYLMKILKIYWVKVYLCGRNLNIKPEMAFIIPTIHWWPRSLESGSGGFAYKCAGKLYYRYIDTIIRVGILFLFQRVALLL